MTIESFFTELEAEMRGFPTLKTDRRQSTLEVRLTGKVQLPIDEIVELESSIEVLVPPMLRHDNGLGCRQILGHLADYLSDADNRRELEESICGCKEETAEAETVMRHLSDILRSNEEYLKARDQ